MMLEPLVQGSIYAVLPAFTAFAKLLNHFSRQSDGDALFGRFFWQPHTPSFSSRLLGREVGNAGVAGQSRACGGFHSLPRSIGPEPRRRWLEIRCGAREDCPGVERNGSVDQVTIEVMKSVVTPSLIVYRFVSPLFMLRGHRRLCPTLALTCRRKRERSGR